MFAVPTVPTSGPAIWSPGRASDLGRLTKPVGRMQLDALGERLFHELLDAHESGEGIEFYGPDDDGKMGYTPHYAKRMKDHGDALLAKLKTTPDGRGLTMEGLEMAMESGAMGTLPFALDELQDVIQLQPRVLGLFRRVGHSFKTVEWNTKTASPGASWAWDGAAITETPSIPLHSDTITPQKVSAVGLITGMSISNFAERVQQAGITAFLQDGRRREIDIALEKAIMTSDGTLGRFKGAPALWDTVKVNKGGAALDILDIESIQDQFLANNPEGAAAPNEAWTDQATLRKVAAWRDPFVTQQWTDPQGINPETTIVVKGIRFRVAPFMPQASGSREIHIVTPGSLAVVDIIPPTLAEYGPLTTARVWAWQWWGTFVDRSANDAVQKDGTGGVKNGRIYAIA